MNTKEINTMSEEKMINDAALETIAAGTERVVKAKSDLYALVKNEPCGTTIGKLSNGTKVNATGRRIFKFGGWWIEINYEGGKAWVANSMLGY